MTLSESSPSDVVVADTPSPSPPSSPPDPVDPTVQVYINGVEVTNCVLSGTVTHRLNKVGSATFRMPIDCAVDGIGKRMKIVIPALANPIDMHGYCTNESADDGTDGDGTVEYTIQDPREIWVWRPARSGPATSDPGNYAKPLWFDEIGTLPQIAEDILLQSIDDSDPNAGEGDLALAMGSFAGGGVDLTGFGPSDFPMTIEELMSVMQDTGELDIVLTYIDSGGNMAQVDGYNGDYGTDLSGSVAFEYATGAHNADNMKRVRDLSQVNNKLYYYLGPKIDDEHWRTLITADDPDLPDPFWNGLTKAAFLALRAAARAALLVRMDVRVYDSFGGVSDTITDSSALPLYLNLWENESVLRLNPKTLVHVTPIAGLLPAFDIGDLITVSAGSAFMGGFTGIQRVYERTLSWDTEGVVQLAEIVSSEDGG